MADLPETTADIPSLLKARAWPSITRWERVDGIPRTHDLGRALRAEVRDPLWMLARQWQLGELDGDDAGSPIFAKLHLGTTRLTGYRPLDGEEQPFDDGVPLEARVEQRPVPFVAGGQRLALDLRLVMGRHWGKLLAKNGLGSYADAFRRAFPIAQPPPADEQGGLVLAHRDAWQHQAAFADRTMDGRLWHEWVVAHPAPRDLGTLPAPLVIDAADRDAVNDLADRFVAWFDRLIDQPVRPDENAWDERRLEYRFGCSAPAAGGRKELVAAEYPGGTLDWYAFDLGPRRDEPPRRPEAQGTATTSFIPVPVEFAGMANTRWWSFEDRRVNLGGVQPDTTDLGKLLMMEFGLVYANDWCVVPVALTTGTIADVRGLVVTNVFGERLWIDAAGNGPADRWQRWRLFTQSPSPGSGRRAPESSLLMLPTVPKVQSGPPLEGAALIRDEMANMVWGIETTVPLPHGEGRTGASAAEETAQYHRRLRSGPPSVPPLENDAKVRYELMTSVPEHWIPFVPVHVPGSSRQVQLQRASLPRVIENDTGSVERIKPRTSLLRVGLDEDPPVAYFVHEEEVPRAGVRVEQCYQRTRWTDGRAVVWLGAAKQVGRGESASQLAFDRLVSVKPR